MNTPTGKLLYYRPQHLFDEAIYAIADLVHVEAHPDVCGNTYYRVHVEVNEELHTLTVLWGNPFAMRGWPDGEYPAEVLVIDDATFWALADVPPYPECEVML